MSTPSSTIWSTGSLPPQISADAITRRGQRPGGTVLRAVAFPGPYTAMRAAATRRPSPISTL
jgi:hypothetical protein